MLSFSRGGAAVAAILAVSAIFLSVLPACDARTAKPAGGPAKFDDPGCSACLAKAASLFASKNPEEALKLLDSWQSRCPRNSQLHLLQSAIFLRTPGKLDEASQAARRAVVAAPASLAAHFQLALCLSLKDERPEAASEFEKVIQLDPANYEAWSSLGKLRAQLHDDEKAKLCEEKAAELEPSRRQIRLRLLKNLGRAGKISEAKAELSRLLKNGDSGAEFAQELATEALNIGAYEEAIEASSRALEQYPRSVSALRALAMAQLWSHHYDDCQRAAAKILDIDAANGDALALESLAMLKSGRAGDAEKSANLAFDRKPDLPLAMLALGATKLAQGDFAAAAENLRRALENDSVLEQAPDACYDLARALDKGGESETALRYYKQSLSRGLSGAEVAQAQQSVARLEVKRGK